MVVVFGGVGNLWGTLIGGMSLGIVNKLLEPYSGAVLGENLRARRADSLHPAAASRTVPADRTRGGEPIVTARRDVCFSRDRRGVSRVVVPLLNLAVPATSPLHLSAYTVTLIGKYLCYATLALAVDLVWGYCGILSLGHAAFFALGGYAMGMYLMRQIGPRGVYGHPVLPDFMVFLNWTELPWFWHGFDQLVVRAR